MERFDQKLLDRLKEVLPDAAVAFLNHQNGRDPTEEELKLVYSHKPGDSEQPPWFVRGETDVGTLECVFPSPIHPLYEAHFALFMTGDGWLAMEIAERPSARPSYRQSLLATSIPYWVCCQKEADQLWDRHFGSDEFFKTLCEYLGWYGVMSQRVPLPFVHEINPEAH